jgi:hypothetical protein
VDVELVVNRDAQSIEAAKLIVADLESRLRDRRRRFIPPLFIIMLALVGATFMVGLRPDLLAQPWWQLASQSALWFLCLIVFPAVGLGLVFWRRGVRAALAIVAVVLAILATLGVPSPQAHDVFSRSEFAGSCALMIAVYAALVLVLGLINGAFVQRHETSAVVWISAGASLMGLVAITWQCPTTTAAHIASSHLAVAVVAMFITSVSGIVVHRRRYPSVPR